MAAAAAKWVICMVLLLSLSFGMCAVRRSFRLSSNLRLRQAVSKINNSTTSSSHSYLPAAASNIVNSTSTLQPSSNSTSLFPNTFLGPSDWFQRCESNNDTGNVDCTCYPGPTGCGYFDCDCDFKDDDDGDGEGDDDGDDDGDGGGGGDNNSAITCDFVYECMTNGTNVTQMIQDLTQKLVAKGLLEY